MKTISRYIMTLALLITAVTGAWADGDTKYTVTFKANGNTKTVENVTLPHTFGCNIDNETDRGTGELDVIIQTLYGLSGGHCASMVPESDNPSVYSDMDDADFQFITISAPFEGTATVTGKYYVSGFVDYSLEITCVDPNAEPTVDVTTDAASEQDLFTEASFNMPAFDATADYELVRDIATGVKALVNNGAECIYVTKVEDKFVPKEAITYKLTDVLDQNNQFDLVEGTDYEKVGMHILDGYTWKDVTDESDLKPGTYEIIFKGLGNYDGKVYSQEFLLSNGYELTIPAGEYATFFKEVALYVEDEDAELYTITSVTDTEAVLSDKLEVVAAETPMLVYNKGEETKTFLLIPTEDQADEVTPAKEFKGSISSGELPASSSTADYYALNGKAFVWVKYAIEIGANKCWLQIGDQPAAARAMTRSIVGGGNTTNMDDVRWQMEDGNYYDLQGRKVEKPNRKGIYIKGGKKVIVR